MNRVIFGVLSCVTRCLNEEKAQNDELTPQNNHLNISFDCYIFLYRTKFTIKGTSFIAIDIPLRFRLGNI